MADIDPENRRFGQSGGLVIAPTPFAALASQSTKPPSKGKISVRSAADSNGLRLLPE